MSRSIEDIYKDYKVKKDELAPFETEIYVKIGEFVKIAHDYVRNGYVNPDTSVVTRLGSDFVYWDMGNLPLNPFYGFEIYEEGVFIKTQGYDYDDDLEISFYELDNAEEVILKEVKDFVSKKNTVANADWERKRSNLEKKLEEHLNSRP